MKKLPCILNLNFSGWLVFVVLFLSQQSFNVLKAQSVQQQIRVTGKVHDNNGEPLPGASIVIEGTTRGVTTDLDGSYFIDARPLDKLVFSFVGFEPQSIAVGDQTSINVMLQEKRDQLEEVTIVGYGSQRKESVIGAITSVSVNELRMPVGKVSTSLAGQMAGVVAVQRSGEPGAGADFWIRGVSTFGTNNKPLILVDGIERDLDLVDTEDIETFSILKDATATAVYGVRGANGVVLITTRRGKEGKPVVTARAEFGILSPTKMPKMANAEQYMDLYNDVYREINGVDFYTPELRAKYLSGEDPDLYPNVDWLGVIYKDVATSQRVNVNVTGGSTNIRYYVAGSYYNENGIYDADKGDYNPSMRWSKYNFRSNVDIDLSKSTVLNLNLSTQFDIKNRPNSKSGGVDQLWIYSYLTIPIAIPPIYSDGTIARPMSAGTNPYNTLNKTGYVQEFNNNAQTLVGLTQDFSDLITPGLKANVKFSWDVVNYSLVSRVLSPSTYYATGRDADGNLIFHKNNDGSDYLTFSRSNTGSRTMYVEASITYDRVFAEKHRVGGLFLFNLRENVNNVPSDYTTSIPYRNLGIAGRATYSYMDKYFIEGNFGYNGSENFAPGHQFGFFPSIAVGYLISNEQFFEPIRSTINLLKLKGSHGKIGNDKIGGGKRFAFNSDMNGSAAGWQFGQSGQTSLTGIATGYPGNPDVEWEQSIKTNIGIEIGLYNQFKLQADYFYEKRENIFLLQESVPSVVGANVNPYLNLGRMKNQGVDLALEYNKQFNEFFISVRANFTYNRNRKLYDDKPTPLMKYQELAGRPLYQQFGLVALGYFESEEDIANSPVQGFGTVRPGDVKFRDINGDGMVNALDQIAIGYTHVPEFNYGFGASAMWKGFDLSLFFQGVGNVTGFLDGSPINGFEQNAVMGGVFADIADKRWREQNPDPNAEYPRMALSTNQNNKQLGTHKQRNMSFMRLKNAELGYTLPKQISSKIKLSTVRFYLQGVNLLTFAKFDLWDPEINNSQGSVYPNMRIVNLGVNLNF
ncbi:MAG: TonB-dependent receptor [Bacteroidales bacterium]|jgi:TonB-linked SusC/RagA family outer membrane protein|nr:TonB-dependent receptor [Bacteroidales bacterium]